jgi:hypothetical protein
MTACLGRDGNGRTVREKRAGAEVLHIDGRGMGAGVELEVPVEREHERIAGLRCPRLRAMPVCGTACGTTTNPPAEPAGAPVGSTMNSAGIEIGVVPQFFSVTLTQMVAKLKPCGGYPDLGVKLSELHAGGVGAGGPIALRPPPPPPPPDATLAFWLDATIAVRGSVDSLHPIIAVAARTPRTQRVRGDIRERPGI